MLVVVVFGQRRQLGLPTQAVTTTALEFPASHVGLVYLPHAPAGIVPYEAKSTVAIVAPASGQSRSRNSARTAPGVVIPPAWRPQKGVTKGEEFAELLLGRSVCSRRLGSDAAAVAAISAAMPAGKHGGMYQCITAASFGTSLK